MYRFARFVTIALCAVMLASPASAYIERGTVHITADTKEIELSAGSSQTLQIALDPMQDSQMPGCGMADCPSSCGDCLTPDGNCPCDGTEYETYYTEVLTSSSDPAIEEALWEDGEVRLDAYRAGACTIKLSARLREYTGTSVEIAVTVVDNTPDFKLWVGIGGILLIGIILILKKKREDSK